MDEKLKEEINTKKTHKEESFKWGREANEWTLDISDYKLLLERQGESKQK